MKSFLGFLRTTVGGGILFLVPVIVLVAIIGKALDISRRFVEPLAAHIPVESLGGVRTPRLLAIAAIILFCFLAGLVARTRLARRMVDWLESALLSNLPGYSLMKSVGETMVGFEREHAYEAVLARIEDAWQIAFLVERIEGGHVAVFVPGAPSPWSGAVYFMTEDRIKPLQGELKSALRCVRRLGMGSNALLGGRL